MNVKKGIQRLLTERGITQGKLGSMLGKTKANTSRYMQRDDFRLTSDICKIADVLGYDVRLQFVDRETGRIIDCDD